MKQKMPPLQGKIGCRELSADKRYRPDIRWWICGKAVSLCVDSFSVIEGVEVGGIFYKSKVLVTTVDCSP